MKAIGFDLGGTLIKYEDAPLSWQSLYKKALTEVAENCSCRVEEEDISLAEEILIKYNTRLNYRVKEVPADKIFQEILSAWEVETNDNLTAAKEIFFSYFQRKTALFTDTIPALKQLKNKGIKVGVLTDVPYGMDKRFVKRDIKEINQYLDVILTSVEVGYRKPDARPYKELANSLGVVPEEMAYIGNEEKDVVGAKKVGSYSVLVDRKEEGNSFGESLRISSLKEFARLV